MMGEAIGSEVCSQRYDQEKEDLVALQEEEVKLRVPEIRG
jgi:hypothetical protein